MPRLLSPTWPPLAVTSALAFTGGVVLTDDARTAHGTAATRPALPVEDPQLVLVYSGPDRDAQLYISAGATVPIAELRLLDPNGRVVANAAFNDAQRLGQADVRLETPEPTVARLRRAYPPGVYRWTGRTVTGRPITGHTRLTYRLLAPPQEQLSRVVDDGH